MEIPEKRVIFRFALHVEARGYGWICFPNKGICGFNLTWAFV
jgi:hypothetical protein